MSYGFDFTFRFSKEDMPSVRWEKDQVPAKDYNHLNTYVAVSLSKENSEIWFFGPESLLKQIFKENT